MIVIEFLLYIGYTPYLTVQYHLMKETQMPGIEIPWYTSGFT